MARIIFHLGPGKCGSSAVQAFLRRSADAENACLDVEVPRPKDIAAMESGDSDTVRRYAARMARTAAPHLPLIISHEALFKKRGALLALVRAAREQGAETSALAYVRRTSDYLRSVHGQWLFREPGRIAETAGILRSHDIDPMLFTGVERHLIAIALGHQDVGRDAGGYTTFDWSESMSQMAQMLGALDVPFAVGALPSRDAERPLLADFAARIGIATDGGALTDQALVNPAFDATVIEAVCNSIELGFAMPGRHEANRFLAAGDADVQAIPLPDPAFLTWLGDCIDTRFEARNLRFAEAFGIDPAYFKPRKMRDPGDLADRIQQETTLRCDLPETERLARIKARAEAMNRAWQRYLSGA